MCLDTIEKFKVHRYYGWKVFIKNNKEEIFNLFRYIGNPIEINKWLTSRVEEIEMIEFPFYKRGFHIFKNKKDAELLAKFLMGDSKNYVIKKVQFTEILETGYEGWWGKTMPVIVVNKMKIL